jgi:RND family efflux transporter MFP subunit
MFSLATSCSQETVEKSGHGGSERKVAVVVEPVLLKSQSTRVEAVGTSEAVRSIILFPASIGEVTAVNFRPGQLVNEGDVLLTLESRDESLALELAKVRFEEAERLYDRYLESAESGATPPTTLDAAKAELDATRIILGRAQVTLDDRVVLAPFTGHVGITDVEVGDRIQTSTPITSLDDRSVLLVAFDVPEMMVGQFKVGDSMEIATWSVEGLSALGEVYEIDSRINMATRTFVTRAQVVNQDDRLRPGMSFRVTLNVEGDTYPVLPEIALQWGANGSFIWAVEEGLATRVPVEIVQRQQGKVLVKSSLVEGDLIVIEGLQRLRPGVTVTSNTAVAAKSSAARGQG